MVEFAGATGDLALAVCGEEELIHRDFDASERRVGGEKRAELRGGFFDVGTGDEQTAAGMTGGAKFGRGQERARRGGGVGGDKIGGGAEEVAAAGGGEGERVC